MALVFLTKLPIFSKTFKNHVSKIKNTFPLNLMVKLFFENFDFVTFSVTMKIFKMFEKIIFGWKSIYGIIQACKFWFDDSPAFFSAGTMYFLLVNSVFSSCQQTASISDATKTFHLNQPMSASGKLYPIFTP